MYPIEERISIDLEGNLIFDLQAIQADCLAAVGVTELDAALEAVGVYLLTHFGPDFPVEIDYRISDGTRMRGKGTALELTTGCLPLEFVEEESNERERN